MSEISVRPIVEGDFEVWRALWTGYLAYYESTVPEAVYHTTFTRLLKGNAGADDADGDAAYEPRGLLAIREGVAVGLVHYMYHRHCWREENVCYLQDLFSTPDQRGVGIGRHLIEAVYTAADAAGCPNVYWMTQDFNAAGRRLYDYVGQLTPFIKYQRPSA